MNRKRLAGMAIFSAFLVSLTACGGSGNEVKGLQVSTSSAVSSDAPAGKLAVDQNETAKKQSSPVESEKKSADSSTTDSSAAAVPVKKELQDPKQAAAAEKKRLSTKEKKYVEAAEEANAGDSADGAPAVDPRAVAEGGEATCQRLEFLEKADPASVPGILASDELANAEAAIRLLCPDFASQWRQSSAGFADGQFKVGKKTTKATVTKGAYVAQTPGEGCTWTVRDKDGEVVSSGGIGKKKDFQMTVGKSAEQVESTGCYAWLPQGNGGNGTSG